MKLTLEKPDGEIVEIESSKFRIAWHNDDPIPPGNEYDDDDPEWFYDEWEE